MDKVVLISGAARGIGKAIAKELFLHGYKLCLLYNESSEAAGELVKAFNDGGNLRAIALQCDVRDYDSCRAAVDKCIAVFGRITHLINNAGIAHIAPLIDTTINNWRNIMDTNLNAAYYLTSAALPSMLDNMYGNIINMSSVWGIYGASCEVAYSASKAGLIGFTKALAQELGLSNIRVNAIAAGVIDTDMNASLKVEDMQELIGKTPMSRIGSPQDIANACLYLAEDASSFVTGHVLEVAGGFRG